MDWQKAKNILCVRLDSIGDVLMTTPAIRAIKENLPDAQVTLLTSPAGAVAGRLVPEVDDVMVYEAPWMKATPPRENSSQDEIFLRNLKKRSFDAAVIFTVYSQNPLPAAFLCYLADIPLRLAHCHENSYQLLTDCVNDPEPAKKIRHEVRRQLDLVAAVGFSVRDECMSIRITKNGEQVVEKIVAQMNLSDGQKLIVIHPGATAASRRYSPRSFAEVARRMVRESNCHLFFTGSKEEAAIIDEIRSDLPLQTTSLAGALDFESLVALIARADLLIVNNTGPAHIAAAVGTPVVDLYALTNPQHTPWAVPCRVLFHDVPCKFCYKSVCPKGHHECLELVSPEAVVEAAHELLNYDEERDPHVHTGYKCSLS
jgi:lipopolysaccharide heptosyltransferase II